MIIKKYIVDDMKQAITRAKYEFGSEAMILSQRDIRDGKWYNPFKKKKLEVTVAVETNDKKRESKQAESKKEKLAEKPFDPIRYEIEDDIDYNFNNKIIEDASKGIKQKLKSYCQLKGLKTDELSLKDIREFIEIGFEENPFQKKLGFKKINILIGPTGVGKTTTIAKIAAKEHLESNKKIGIITIDTYKIGAVEQIKAYANILAMPFEVVKKPEEMQKALDRLSYCDLILIDTLGTSQRNTDKLNEIRDYIKDFQNQANTYLVVSVSTDRKTMISILDKYKKLKYEAIILTKFDEVTSSENFWSIIENNSYPIEYFCYGQEVPEDIKRASLENLISYSKEIYKND